MGFFFAVSPAVKRLFRFAIVVEWKSDQPFPQKGEAMNVHAYNDAIELTKIILENNSSLLVANDKTADKQAERLAAFIQVLTEELTTIHSPD